MTALIPSEPIDRVIIVLRGIRVILDKDLAPLYEVTVKRLNEQVRRNMPRFPPDFMFQLSPEEAEHLRSQIATLKKGRRGQHRKYLPYAFTEHGAIMAASVLNSAKAIEISVLVIRAFVRLRAILATDRELTNKLNEIERKVTTHDQHIAALFSAIRELMKPADMHGSKPIGFLSKAKT